MIINEKHQLIECENCGRMFHELENGNIPGYADLCSICNAEWFDDN